MEDNYFIILCWFLPYSNMNWPWVYIGPLRLEPPSHLPPYATLLGCHRSPDLSSLHHTPQIPLSDFKGYTESGRLRFEKPELLNLCVTFKVLQTLIISPFWLHLSTLTSFKNKALSFLGKPSVWVITHLPTVLRYFSLGEGHKTARFG